MNKLLGNQKNGLVFVISAPAGTGKTTLVRMLRNEFSCVVESISYTTRQPRPGEVDGVHYHFIDEKEFKAKIANEEFLEFVSLYGHYYGTGYQAIQELQKQGKHVILVIDTQGAMQLKAMELKCAFKAIYIFLKPPSLKILKERLLTRSTENTQVIEKRLDWAKQELVAASQYDYCIVNDDLMIAYQILRSIFIAEEHRIQ